jgi:O-antigen/teichoic acid export membrane protein
VALKFFSLAKMISQFVSVQIIVQVLGFSSAILLIRNLTKQEYAYFVLANSFQGAINILADSGVGSAVSAIGGKVWQDSDRLGQLVKAALQFRRYLGVLATLIIAPILIYTLVNNGTSLIYSIILTIGILIELYFYLDLGVMGVVPRLHAQITRIQKLDLIYAVSRLATLLAISIVHLNAAIGIFASTIASGLKSVLLWEWVKDTVNVNVNVNEDDQKVILEIVKNDAPNCLFYCVQGQISVWLIGIFGKTENIAELGALSRISIIYLLITSILNNILLPQFSKCQNKKIIIKLYFRILLLYISVSFIVFVMVVFFSDFLLSILGNGYKNLNNELYLVIIQVSAGQIIMAMSSINLSKGWIQPPLISIPLILISQVIFLFVFDLSTVYGVLLFGICTNIPSLLISIFVTYKGIKSYV